MAEGHRQKSMFASLMHFFLGPSSLGSGGKDDSFSRAGWKVNSGEAFSLLPFDEHEGKSSTVGVREKLVHGYGRPDVGNVPAFRLLGGFEGDPLHPTLLVSHSGYLGVDHRMMTEQRDNTRTAKLCGFLNQPVHFFAFEQPLSQHKGWTVRGWSRIVFHNGALKKVSTKARDVEGVPMPLSGGDEKGVADANSQAFEEMMGEGACDGDRVMMNGVLVNEEDRHGDGQRAGNPSGAG